MVRIVDNIIVGVRFDDFWVGVIMFSIDVILEFGLFWYIFNRVVKDVILVFNFIIGDIFIYKVIDIMYD